jgi:hypothetical protein
VEQLYFCVGCRTVHYDEDYNKEDGDLLIPSWGSFMESVKRVDKEMVNHG